MIANHQTGFAELNGACIYYESAGEGPPLVLVHAGICSSRMWDKQFAEFAKVYHVVRYDMRGYGQSNPVDGLYFHHQDLHELLNFLGIARAHLVGCSIGGATIIDFALAYPAQVASLILVCSALNGYQNPEPRRPPPNLEEIVTAFEQGDLAPANEHDLRTWVDGPQRNPEQVDPMVRAQVSEMNLLALKNEAMELGEEQTLKPAGAQRLHEIRGATLLINGDLDQPLILRISEQLAAHITHTRNVVIPGTAHLPNMEQPAHFNTTVLSFLAQK